MKIVKKIQLKIVIFTAMENRCILHGRVFVMIFLVFRFLDPTIFHYISLQDFLYFERSGTGDQLHNSS